MAKERTEKSCYQSKFGAGWIAAPKFLAEIACERMALAQKDRLAHRFWDDPYWAKKFVAQVKHATELLAQFPIEVILESLKHPDLKKVYSLGLKSAIIPIAQRISKKMAQAPAAIEQEISSIDVTEKPRQTFSYKSNTLKKIRELE